VYVGILLLFKKRACTVVTAFKLSQTRFVKRNKAFSDKVGYVMTSSLRMIVDVKEHK